MTQNGLLMAFTSKPKQYPKKDVGGAEDTNQNEYNNTSCYCSICLSEINDGDMIGNLECNHMFHNVILRYGFLDTIAVLVSALQHRQKMVRARAILLLI
jgi:hypothetical protein